MLTPEFDLRMDSQVAIENIWPPRFFQEGIPAEIVDYWRERSFTRSVGGIGHLSLDWQRIIDVGLAGALADLDRHWDEGGESPRLYRRAMRIAVEAVVEWAGRYAEAAERAAAEESDPALAACHRRVAAACRWVPLHPARDLFEGLQTILLLHLASVLEGQGMSMSIGLPDRALRRFAAEAAADPQGAADLVSAFLLGVAANSFQGRATKTQAITVGGADASGADCSNALTQAFLRAFAQTPVPDPHLFLRWHPALDAHIWAQACEMLSRGRSMPSLVSDAQVAPALIEAGVAPADAYDYCIIGCNELGIPGRCCQSGNSMGMGFDDLALLDQALRAQPETFANTAEIVRAYEAEVERRAEAGVEKRRQGTDEWAEQAPFPFCSACCRGPAEAGDDLLRAMPYPRLYGLFMRGASNATNALAAIEQEVFERRHYTLPQYLAAVDAGDATLLERIRCAPAWGNDDEAADRWGVALNEARDRALRRVAARHGLPPFAVCHVVRSLNYLDGKHIAATADGRPAGAPVGDSLGAVLGTARKGPTALLNSLTKIPAARCFSGIYNLNLTLSPSQGRAEVVRGLAEGFFQRGGQELQVNVLDAAALRDAQQRPERYRDLVVRVAGLNARFVELARLEQDDLIRRAEALN
jgi:formate C-acetyltransferase